MKRINNNTLLQVEPVDSLIARYTVYTSVQITLTSFTGNVTNVSISNTPNEKRQMSKSLKVKT